MNILTIGLLAAATSIPALSQFLDFMFIVTLVLGISLLGAGSWNLSSGRTQEGINCVAAAFLMAASVPIIRMFAAWLGVSI